MASPGKGRFAPRRQTPLAMVSSQGGVAVLAYCLSSMSMTLVNKYVVSGPSWNLHILYLAIQHIICSVAIIGGRQVGLIKDMDDFNLQRARRWLPIALLLVGMVFTGNRALQFLSVPVFTICKNLTVIVIAYGEVFLFGSSVSALSFLSFALMVFSSVLAAWSDFSHAKTTTSHSDDPMVTVSSLNVGYFWMSLNIFTSALYALGMRKGMNTVQLKNWDVMFYNNVLTIPVLLGASLLLEDWSYANLRSNFPSESRQSLILGMIYSGIGAIFISYCTAWCIRATSSTTYAMAGALNKLPTAIAGLLFFADPATFGNVSAIFLGFISGLMFTVAKNKKASASKPTPLLPTAGQKSAKE